MGGKIHVQKDIKIQKRGLIMVTDKRKVVLVGTGMVGNDISIKYLFGG